MQMKPARTLKIITGDIVSCLDRHVLRSGDVYALELVRIFISLALIWEFLSALPHLSAFSFLVSAAPNTGATGILKLIDNWGLFHSGLPLWFVQLVFTVGALSAVCLLFGRFSKLNVLLLFGITLWLRCSWHYLNYGVDRITLPLLTLLIIAPVGSRWSIDYSRRRVSGRVDDNAFIAVERRSVILRLLQLQVAVIYFFNGYEKAKGPLWLSGEAFWYTLSSFYYPVSPDMFVGVPALIHFLTYFALITELTYPVAVWFPQTRWLCFCAAFLLHLGIALVMGLWFFSLAALALHMSFFSISWIDSVRLYVESIRSRLEGVT